MGFWSANKAVYWAKYHLMWCPKYRCRILAGRVGQRLKEIICEAGGQVIEVEVMPDHVQLLVEIPPPVRLSMLVQELKGRSSRLLRAEFAGLARLAGLGSPWWLVSTVGGTPLGLVGRCVENQRAAV